ncbi:phosphatidate cytidylyltransferase [Amaricoccus tamworthensis]|uniref:phosphatidate cytidylyltransferase n=1 Tax=Amaricoccus tamworthensis TaxID=57002 RepID=UPI003C7D831E
MKPLSGQGSRFSDLGLRLGSAVVLALGGAFVIWLGGPVFVLATAVVLALMLWEYVRMISGDRSIFNLPLLLSGLGGIAWVLLAGSGWTYVGLMCLVAGALAAGLVAGRRFEWLAGGVLYLGIAAGTAVILLNLPTQGMETVILLILVVISADVGAYFTGRSVGGKKLWPAVSPGKTWSGAFGGLAAAAVVGAVFAAAVGWSVPWAIVVSLLVAVGSQCGDLLESAVKRQSGVKDSSNVIPGHGGVLDRFDGILGGLLVYAVLHALGLGLVGQ